MGETQRMCRSSHHQGVEARKMFQPNNKTTPSVRMLAQDNIMLPSYDKLHHSQPQFSFQCHEHCKTAWIYSCGRKSLSAVSIMHPHQAYGCSSFATIQRSQLLFSYSRLSEEDLTEHPTEILLAAPNACVENAH